VTVPDKPLLPVSRQVVARLYSREPVGLSQVARRIREAKAPVIIAGMGVRWDRAYPQLERLAERLGAPVFTTPKVKGAIPEKHPYSAGVFIGGKLELDILGRADLIVGVGLDPADMLAKPWRYRQPIISIDRVSNYNEIFHAEAELETAMALVVAPVIVVMSDRALSQIKIKQEKKGLRTVGTEFQGADYARVAEAFGARGSR
ncbi:MAG: thiamine pyrophosphate-dependent enzyme, partial [Chloroflexi bacterium]|nr:thiamine pyrophosphate-dependent enzyme [Chloroflexota bacterium]